MDFGKIAAKLRAATTTSAENTEISGESSCPHAGGDGEGGVRAAAEHGVGSDQSAIVNGEEGCRPVGEVGFYSPQGS